MGVKSHRESRCCAAASFSQGFCSPAHRNALRARNRTADGAPATGPDRRVVSKFCLGAMMFGAWGNRDHDESIEVVHAALDAGSTSLTPPTTMGRAGRRGSSARRSRRPGDDVILATKFHKRWQGIPTGRATAPLDDPRHRGSLRRLGADWIRPVPVHHINPPTDIEGSAVGAERSTCTRARVRLARNLHVPGSRDASRRDGWRPNRRLQRFVTERLPHTRSSSPHHRGRRPADVRAPRHGCSCPTRPLAAGLRSLAAQHKDTGRLILLARRPTARALRSLPAGEPSASSTPPRR